MRKLTLSVKHVLLQFLERLVRQDESLLEPELRLAFFCLTNASAHFLFLPPRPVLSASFRIQVALLNSQEVIRSATPALSCKKVSSLTSSKNSWQKCFISIRPIRMMAAACQLILLTLLLTHPWSCFRSPIHQQSQLRRRQCSSGRRKERHRRPGNKLKSPTALRSLTSATRLTRKFWVPVDQSCLFQCVLSAAHQRVSATSFPPPPSCIQW